MGLTVQNSVPVWWYTMPLMGEQMCSKDIHYSLGVDLGRSPKPSTLPCSTKSTANPSHFFQIVQMLSLISFNFTRLFPMADILRATPGYASHPKNQPLERAILHGKCV